MNGPRTARAFSPGHITGLFRALDSDPDPLRRGSVGAGFCIDAGVEATVTLSDRPGGFKVLYNGVVIDAPVTVMVVRDIVQRFGLNGHGVTVSYRSPLKIGAGFGASGAGALSASIALGSLVDRNMSLNEAGQFAHRAEVENKTGLGDVIAQTVGGMEVRTRPGAPGIGELIQVQHPQDIRVVLAGGVMSTKSVLSDPDYRARIEQVSRQLVSEVTASPSVDSIIDCSRRFSVGIGLMSARIRSTLEQLDRQGLTRSSMVMLGDSVFCLCHDDEVADAVSTLSRYWSAEDIITTTISKTGGHLL
ncbi:MAG: GHMP kinase [Candidatus Thorarchaeota archaeon]